MKEKRWEAVDPQALLVDGGALGKIEIPNAIDFHVKQIVKIDSSTQNKILLEVKSIISVTELYVGPRGNIDLREDVSAYLAADTATLEADEQPRPAIPLQELERASFEEEPVVAKRVIQVDRLGNKYDADNPMPTAPNAISKYVTHDLSEPTNTETYIGKETATGIWLLQYILEVGKDTIITYANISNNPAVDTYTQAWTDRAILTYDLLENLKQI